MANVRSPALGHADLRGAIQDQPLSWRALNHGSVVIGGRSLAWLPVSSTLCAADNSENGKRYPVD